MIHKFYLTLNAKLEEITGVLTGSVVGVIAHRTFADFLITALIALATGFLGALGAYGFKLFKARFLTRK
jgi:hypothetical protein